MVFVRPVASIRHKVEAISMRCKWLVWLFAVSVSGLGTCALLSGCGGGESPNPQIIAVPPASAGEKKPVPPTQKAGGGKGSSGNMTRDPGAST
jgi:hypothetical protein